MLVDPVNVLICESGVIVSASTFVPHMTSPPQLGMFLKAEVSLGTFSDVHVMLLDMLNVYALVTLDMFRQVNENIPNCGSPDKPLISKNPSGNEVTLDMPRQADWNILAAGAPDNPRVSMKPSGSEVTLDMLRQAS